MSGLPVLQLTAPTSAKPKCGIGSHQRSKGAKDEWLTPPTIIQALGPFDLDPCAPVVRPWPTAERHFTIEDNGLRKKWEGRVWLNPPYKRDEIGLWLGRLVEHGNGIALIFARTETEDWFNHIWNRADAVLFMLGRVRFLHVDGT